MPITTITTATIPTATVHHSHRDLFAVQIRRSDALDTVTLNGYTLTVATDIAVNLSAALADAYRAGRHDQQIATAVA